MYTISSISVAYLGSESFSLPFAAPSPADANSNSDQDDRDDDAAERNDELDPLVERRPVVDHHTTRDERHGRVVPRRLELEETVGGPGGTAGGHS